MAGCKSCSVVRYFFNLLLLFSCSFSALCLKRACLDALRQKTVGSKYIVLGGLNSDSLVWLQRYNRVMELELKPRSSYGE